jgi:hypothetical protein
MAKIKGKGNLLKNLKAIKSEGSRIEHPGPVRNVKHDVIREMQSAGVSPPRQRTWLYKQSDLVRVRDWRFGTFIGTVIEQGEDVLTVMGPMGLVVVSPRSVNLIDRYDDPVPATQDDVE